MRYEVIKSKFVNGSIAAMAVILYNVAVNCRKEKVCDVVMQVYYHDEDEGATANHEYNTLCQRKYSWTMDEGAILLLLFCGQSNAGYRPSAIANVIVRFGTRDRSSDREYRQLG